MIPKIIHQTAYANKEEWHPIWKHCQQSTLKHFKVLISLFVFFKLFLNILIEI